MIYEPREIAVGVKAALDKIPDQAARKTAEAHLAGRNTSWDPSAFTDYPMDLVIGDLHRVADAAGMDKFVLAGYSGTARLAAFYAAHSKRAVGMVIGGDHILGSQDYWIGYLAGSGTAQASMPGTSEITKQLGRLRRERGWGGGRLTDGELLLRRPDRSSGQERPGRVRKAGLQILPAGGSGPRSGRPCGRQGRPVDPTSAY